MFGNKKTQDMLQALGKTLEAKAAGVENLLRDQAAGFEEIVQTWKQEPLRGQDMQDLHQELQGVEETLAKTQAVISSHDMAIEDMLESWEEFQEGQEKQAQVWKEFLAGQDRLTDRLAGQDALLSLCAEYEKQLLLLGRALPPEWDRQMSLVEEQLKAARVKAGFVVLGYIGEPVDYSLHEVVSVVDTLQEEENGRIEGIFETGYAFRGEIRKKAKVSAYRLLKSEDEGE